MTEATLKGALVKAIRERMPGIVVFRHEDHFTSGIPDLSITWRGKTSWWEVKFANPRFASKGIQELTMLRLSNVGIANYLIYRLLNEHKTVHIVSPQNLRVWEALGPSTMGFDHQWVIDRIKEIHGT